MRDCGGCNGEQRHRKHCRRNPDYDWRMEIADSAENLGDRIGPSNFEAANLAYACAGVLRQESREIRRQRDAMD